MRSRVVCIDLEVLLDCSERDRMLAYSDLSRECWLDIQLNNESRSFLDKLRNYACDLCLVSGEGNSMQQVVDLYGLGRWFSSDNIKESFNYNEEGYYYYMEKFPGCKYFFIADVKRDFHIPNKLGWTTCGLMDITDVETPLSRGAYDDLLYSRINGYSLRGFQDIIIPQRTDFIVPIMEDTNNEGTQQGTGFIVDQYLITAAHVFYNLNVDGHRCEELKYKFDDREFSINLREALFDGHKCEFRKGFSQDLLVFRVNHKGSPFSLNTGDISEGVVLETRAYYYDGEKMQTQSINNIHPIGTNAYNSNCIDVKGECGFPFKDGNSGCPIYVDNIVYGTLWKVIEHSSADKLYVFVDARYINDVLQKPQ